MFFEKYPQKVFTAKILNLFFDIGKELFVGTNNVEIKCSNYFKHILLNEKILSKYDSKLQIDFWNKLFLFHESDKTQIQNLLNINSQEQKNVIDLFKLLTFDLSLCLAKFILNIFIHSFKENKNEEWNKKLVLQLLPIKFQVIIINTFTYSLPDIRIELLKFVYHVHMRLISKGNTGKFYIFEKMLKSCLLLDKKFSTKSTINTPGAHIANPPKKKVKKKKNQKMIIIITIIKYIKKVISQKFYLNLKVGKLLQ
jgi:hypothetical protein